MSPVFCCPKILILASETKTRVVRSRLNVRRLVSDVLGGFPSFRTDDDQKTIGLAIKRRAAKQQGKSWLVFNFHLAPLLTGNYSTLGQLIPQATPARYSEKGVCRGVCTETPISLLDQVTDRDVGCLTLTKREFRFRKIQLESKWNTIFRFIQLEISGSNRISE